MMWVWVSKWENTCRGNGLYEEMGATGTSENMDRHLASRSVLKDFIDDALTISAGTFIPNWDSTNAESVLATAGITSLFLGLKGVAAGGMGEGWFFGQFEKTMVNLENGY